MKYSVFITNYVGFAFWPFSIIFTFATICNKLFKLKIHKKFRRICSFSFVTTNYETQLDSLDMKNKVVELYYKLRWVWLFAMFDDFHIRRNL